jgi:N-ethylmaleimide reductase
MSIADAAQPKLFTPVTLGGEHDPILLHHRISMAPLSRLRADDTGVQATIAVTYYEQRATLGGLLVTEPTNISPTARGNLASPGIFTPPQVAAWKPIADAVHAKRGFIFMSLYHAGRLSHSNLQPHGELPVSASNHMPLNANRTVRTASGDLPMETPRALKTEEIPMICSEYRLAAENALAAGFDGVEIHAGNGDLLEEFLHDGINDRTDKYGGSILHRARFLLEVMDEVLKSVPSSRVAVRLSPYSKSCGQFDSNPAATYAYVLEKLSAYDLAYTHLIEPRGYHYVNELKPPGGATAYFRPFYKGVLMTVSGYDRQKAIDAVEEGHADLVAIGRYFISNPDLVKRFQRNATLTPYDRATSYGDGERGYTDYPFMDEDEGEEQGGSNI